MIVQCSVLYISKLDQNLNLASRLVGWVFI